VGAEECLGHFGTCDLSEGIVTDDQAGTLTFHLREADPDFLQKLAVPFAVAIPATVSRHDVGDKPVPATGPYMISSLNKGEIRLVRNPRFQEWSRLARPYGYPDEIVWTIEEDIDKQLDMIIDGSADAMVGWPFERPNAERVAQMRAQYPTQVHPWLSGTMLYFMNTSLPPFDDVNVRQSREPRARPRQAGRPAGRTTSGGGDVSGPASQHAGLPTVLPVYDQPEPGRNLDGARWSEGPAARGGIG
jgi:peptide/nickel transport system substrate-binding protein